MKAKQSKKRKSLYPELEAKRPLTRPGVSEIVVTKPTD
jgi:hypothetical protein